MPGYGNFIWGPQYYLDQQALVGKGSKESHKITSSIERLRFCALPEAEGIKMIKLPSPQYRRQRGDMIETFKELAG